MVEYDALGLLMKVWGWDVVQSGPGNQSTAPEPSEFEICVPEGGDICKAGAGGSGPGQFSVPGGAAFDSAGDIYVTDFSNHRVQKFAASGEFLLMTGKEVNKTKVEEGTATEEEENICPFDPGDECKAGVSGAGPWQFGDWGVGDVIAIDSADKVYVGDFQRIERFDADGVYQDQCTVPGRVQSLATDSSGKLYVAYENQFGVRKLDYVAAAACEETRRFDIPEPDEFTHPLPTAVAVDGSGDVYAFSDAATGNGFVPLNRIFEFDTSGNVVDEFGKEEFTASTGLATNLCPGSQAPGNLYVTNLSSTNGFLRAYGTEPVGCFKALTLPATDVTETSATLNGTVNPGGALSEECRFEWGTSTAYGNVADCAEAEAAIGKGTEPVPVHADLAGLTAGTVYHFRLRAKIGGATETGPDEAFKTKGPPVISDQHVVLSTHDEATVRALVNPEGFPTSCRVEFGESEGYGQSTAEIGVGADRSEHPTTAVLEGLQEGTTYHWRFVCDNSAVAAEGITKGPDRTLRTYRLPLVAPCPNDAFRAGSSSRLPDCRAYEMVSPVDKNGADVIGRRTAGEDIVNYVQATPGGERLTYATYFPAFCDAPNSFNLNQYLAQRTERGLPDEGWSCEGIHPPYLGQRLPGTVPGLNRGFIAFTPDLCNAWLLDLQTPALLPDGQDDAANLYRRDNCDPGAGDLEVLTDVPVPLAGEARSRYVDQFSVQGVSDDGDHAIFVATAKLTGDAAAGANPQLYDRFEGGLHLVSVLPSGVAESNGAVVGGGWQGNLANAVSKDGSVVYWTADADGVGKIFARLHPEQEQSALSGGECTEPEMACTVAVSKGTTVPLFHEATFWAATPEGSKALYSEGSLKDSAADLYLFDLASKTSQKIAQNTMGVVGTSEDLSRIYLVSRKALAGGAVEGQPNLYLLEGGEFSFVATLLEGELSGEDTSIPYSYAAVLKKTLLRPTRVTPDGGRIVFETRAAPTGFDNAAAGSGKPAVEVFTYSADAKELACVSCNPSGARPRVRELPEPYKRPGHSRVTNVVAAAWIPTWEHPLHASNVLSADGKRIFFNSNDPLLPQDANGAPDVYEWERPGAGGCDLADANYFAANGGCLYLISSGQNAFESEFWEASADGSDVFFTTEQSLLPQDPGSIDLYDARVGGGFPQPATPAGCEGEACQSPPAAPDDPTPASAAFEGAGNVVEESPARCAKPKVRRHGKCVRKHHRAKHKKRSHRRARSNRGGHK